MNGFFERLARRQVEPITLVRPRRLSRFADMEPAAPPNPDVCASELLPAPPTTRRVTGVAAPDRENAAPADGKTHETPMPAAGSQDTGSGQTAKMVPVLEPARRDTRTESASERGRSLPSAAQPSSVKTPPAGYRGGASPKAQTRDTPSPLVPPAHTPRRSASLPLAPASPRATANPRTAERISHAHEVEPVVHVTIGRVEVRAVVEQQPAREKRPAPRPKTLSLDEYLERRHGAKR